MLSGKAASKLELALSIGQFEKSPVGAQLDHLLLYSEQVKPKGEITARPTAECREASKGEPDGLLLEVYGRVSTRLLRVTEGDPKLAAALVAYYGDSGARWCTTKLGRIGSLLQLTEAGKQLAQREARKGAKVPKDRGVLVVVEGVEPALPPKADRPTRAPFVLWKRKEPPQPAKAASAKPALEVSDAQRIETAVALQDIQPQPARESLLDLARRQAWELFEKACKAYSATANASDKE